MKKLLLETSFSKIYMLAVILVSLLIMGCYFSYAMFTVSKEKSNAISIVTGNLTYKLEVDGSEGDILTVPANTIKEFIVTLNNPNNRVTRFNFYYLGELPIGVDAGYIEEDGYNITPDSTGINLEKTCTSGSSNTYIIRVGNKTDNEVTINLGVSVGLDYNDLSLPDSGHLFEESKIEGAVSDIVLDYPGENGSIYDDGFDTFITGEEPNNYIWYSGKLWRAVSVNNEAKTTKLVTQWNISAIPYNEKGNTAFEGSHVEMWLNDTTVDGFLGNLRDYEQFIVMDSKWDATLDNRNLGSITRPNGTTVVNKAVGLLNIYEYQTGYRGTDFSNGYLNNGSWWWLLTPYSLSSVILISGLGEKNISSTMNTMGIRPTINLKSNVRIIDGNGTVDNPYRLSGDNDTSVSGTLLNTRYSGEYIKFGNDENNLYRIVSHETPGLTKITSAEPLKSSGTFITSAFGSNTMFSSSNTIGTFLNGDYLTNYVGDNYSNMIEDSTTWYLGTVDSDDSYKLAKYTDTNMSEYTTSTNSKVGLLRLGELMTGQFSRYRTKDNTVSGLTTGYWTLTKFSSSYMWVENAGGDAKEDASPDGMYAIKPVFNLKSNVVITDGSGTKSDPFIVDLGS